jgi:hypothetical protein
MEKNKYKNIYIIDKKILTPKEKIITGASSKDVFSAGHKNRPLKTVIGRPKIYDLETGRLIADEENLVVLKGREFIAQKMSGLTAGGVDYSKYEIRYFGVGSGATETADGVQDPNDNDESLAEPIKFDAPSGAINTASNDYRYINNGYFKRILSTANDTSGNIQILKEKHEINDSSGNETDVYAYTEIKFTLIIDKGELGDSTVKFNEAGLFAVKYDNDGKPTNDHIMVAKFTTTTKNLGPNDGLRIEWSILV